MIGGGLKINDKFFSGLVLFHFHIDIDTKLFSKIYKYFHVRNLKIHQNQLTKQSKHRIIQKIHRCIIHAKCCCLGFGSSNSLMLPLQLGFAVMHEQHCQSAEVFIFIEAESHTYHLSFVLFFRDKTVEVYGE